MRISLLHKREPFRSILAQTLKRLLIFYDAKAEVFWVKRFSLRFFTSFASLRFQNKYLNFYASYDLDKGHFEPLIKEYGSSQKKGQRILQKLYVKFAVTKIGRVVFSGRALAIKSSSNFYDKVLILGGNHRIRLLKPDANESYVILKEGFRKQWILNDIRFRKENHISFAPKLIGYNENLLFYAEEYLPGTPINRLSEKSCKFYTIEAMRLLEKEIMRFNSHTIEISEWATQKLEKIKQEFSNGFQKKPEREIQENLYELSELLLNTLLTIGKNKNLTLALSHGDFQYANILLKENGGLVVIDWESVDIRWKFYDWLTIALKSRSESFISFKSFQKTIEYDDLLNDNLEFKENAPKLLYLIYAIEELHFEMLNTCEPMFYFSGNGFNEYLLALNQELKNCYVY